jgi:carbon storage regulator CsrA
MLVLSRKPNEEILIGDNIKVTVLKVKGNTVRIGIEAPAAIKVKRGELPDVRPASSQSERAEIELTLSFSPSEEGVTAGTDSAAQRETAARNESAARGKRAKVLKFEPAATKSPRQSGVETASLTAANLTADALLPLPAVDSTERLQGTNRIKEILNRLVSGLPADDLGND